jgi:hypothetical protein
VIGYRVHNTSEVRVLKFSVLKAFDLNTSVHLANCFRPAIDKNNIIDFRFSMSHHVVTIINCSGNPSLTI